MIELNPKSFALLNDKLFFYKNVISIYFLFFPVELDELLFFTNTLDSFTGRFFCSDSFDLCVTSFF